MVSGNMVFGGLIGLAVDAGQGAGYDYPSSITVEMGDSTVIQTQPPQAETNAPAQNY
ncbi:MAG: hypothetical protein HY526_09345 [Betaproteobacteria bacterium]|nr:hypothetical protein [Betaproteobacteria bacterium]